MWVRLSDRYINTDHVIHLKIQGTDDSASGIHYLITYTDGRTDTLNERQAQPLLEALVTQVDKAVAATDSYPSE